MVVLNRMSRFHLAAEALRPQPPPTPRAPTSASSHCDAMLERHRRYVREHFEDMPEIRDWTWPG